MEFIFAQPDDFKPSALQQGDLLIRTEGLRSVLREAHQYYAENESYTHFVVVTQSCDIVRRNGKIKADYITIAAVRPFALILDRVLRRHEFLFKNDSRLGIYNAERREAAQQFLERMLNNEEKGHFFFRRDSHPSITEDMCAFLALSVALKSKHYDALLDAKVAQLDDVFAAKLGWLVGSMYTRVATPDLEDLGRDAETYKGEFYSEKLGDAGHWLSTTRWKRLHETLKKTFAETPTEAQVEAALKDLPDDQDILAERITALLTRSKLLPGDADSQERAFNLLRNDPTIRSIARAFR